MDERQTKIVEGAGLEESRVNRELLDFLNKWSFPALLVVAIVSGAYYFYNLNERRKITERDSAFGQLGAIEGSPSPSTFSLTEIADQFEGVGSVSQLARLQAADVHLDAVRSGVDPADGETELTQEDRAYRLEQAEGLYRRVYDSASGDPVRALIAANAAFGLAAVAETRGDADTARQRYEEARSLAERAGYAPLAAIAAEMAADTAALGEPRLYSEADLPRLPFQPEPLEVSVPVVDEPVGPAAPEGEPPTPAEEPGAEPPAEAPQPTEPPPSEPQPIEPPADPNG